MNSPSHSAFEMDSFPHMNRIYIDERNKFEIERMALKREESVLLQSQVSSSISSRRDRELDHGLATSPKLFRPLPNIGGRKESSKDMCSTLLFAENLNNIINNNNNNNNNTSSAFPNSNLNAENQLLRLSSPLTLTHRTQNKKSILTQARSNPQNKKSVMMGDSVFESQMQIVAQNFAGENHQIGGGNGDCTPGIKKRASKLSIFIHILVNVKGFYRQVTKNSRILHKLTVFEHDTIGDVASNTYSQHRRLLLLHKTGQFISPITHLMFAFTEAFKQFCGVIPVFTPFNPLRRLWDFAQMLLILAVAFLLSLSVFFEMPLEQFQNFLSISLFIFIADSCIACNTAYFYQGNVVKSRMEIFKSYGKRQLMPDFLSLIALAVVTTQNYATTLSPIETGVVKLLFLFKLPKMKGVWNRLHFYLSYEKDFKNLSDLLQLIFLITSVCHVFSLFWHGLALWEINQGRTDTWMHANNLIEADIFRRYVVSFYYLATTMITVGYGDITPKNVIENVFTVLTMFVTGTIWAFFLTTIASILGNIERKEKKYNDTMEVIHGFMREESVHHAIRLKVSNYLEYIYKESNQAVKDQEREIMKNLSEQLQSEMLQEVHGKYIKDIPFLDKFQERSRISLLMEECLFSPGELIFRQNDIDDNALYYLVKGRVQLFLASSTPSRADTRLHTIEKRKYFGEIAFITGNPRTLTAQAVDFCRIFKIKRQPFLKVLANNPADFENFAMIKESMTLKDNYKFSSILCYLCKQGNHLCIECPRTHLKQSQQGIIYRHIFSVPHLERIPCVRRDNSTCRTNARRIIDNVVNAVYEINNQESLFSYLNQLETHFFKASEFHSEDEDQQLEEEEEESQFFQLQQQQQQYQQHISQQSPPTGDPNIQEDQQKQSNPNLAINNNQSNAKGNNRQKMITKQNKLRKLMSGDRQNESQLIVSARQIQEQSITDAREGYKKHSGKVGEAPRPISKTCPNSSSLSSSSSGSQSSSEFTNSASSLSDETTSQNNKRSKSQTNQSGKSNKRPPSISLHSQSFSAAQQKSKSTPSLSHQALNNTINNFNNNNTNTLYNASTIKLPTTPSLTPPQQYHSGVTAAAAAAAAGGMIVQHRRVGGDGEVVEEEYEDPRLSSTPNAQQPQYINHMEALNPSQKRQSELNVQLNHGTLKSNSSLNQISDQFSPPCQPQSTHMPNLMPRKITAAKAPSHLSQGSQLNVLRRQGSQIKYPQVSARNARRTSVSAIPSMEFSEGQSTTYQPQQQQQQQQQQQYQQYQRRSNLQNPIALQESLEKFIENLRLINPALANVSANIFQQQPQQASNNVNHHLQHQNVMHNEQTENEDRRTEGFSYHAAGGITGGTAGGMLYEGQTTTGQAQQAGVRDLKAQRKPTGEHSQLMKRDPNTAAQQLLFNQDVDYEMLRGFECANIYKTYLPLYNYPLVIERYQSVFRQKNEKYTHRRRKALKKAHHQHNRSVNNSNAKKNLCDSIALS